MLSGKGGSEIARREAPRRRSEQREDSMDADTTKALKSLTDRIQVVAHSLNDAWKAIKVVEDKTSDHADTIKDLQQRVAKLEK
jgi:predicted  nucleic acid-binding Zn-ribbon protein